MRFQGFGAAAALIAALIAGPAGAGAKPRVSIQRKLSAEDQQRVSRVREAVQKALTPAEVSNGKAASKDVGGIDVTQKGGVLYITGSAASQALKDKAGQAAAEAAGGRPVVNRLTVR